MAVDKKKIGFAALDLVTGIAAAAVGVTGGPDAAKGVMMAGNSIKTGIGGYTGEEQTRADKHDREGFQARDAVLAQKKQAALIENDDRATSKVELLRLGWSSDRADQILAGPTEGVTLAAVFAPAGDSKGDAVVQQDQRRKPKGTGQTLASADGSTLKATEGKTTEAVDGNAIVSVVGKIVSGAMSK